MKTIKSIIAFAVISCLSISITSCVVVKHDNGKHKGWYKNPNNPHNPNSTNPGNGKNKGKSKGKH